MKKLFLVLSVLVCLVFVFVTPTMAFDEPTEKQKVMYMTFTTLELIDWLQTRYIADNPDKYMEFNSILGESPNLEDVDKYFATCLIGSYILYKTLPDKWKTVYLTGGLILEVGCVGNNYRIGIGLKF